MLTDDKNILQNCVSLKRVWQGIPGIEVTKGGRIFACFYSGGTREEIGNFAALIVSDDGGKTFSEPIFAAFEEGHRCYDPCLWIDPRGRLWFCWAKYPNDGVYAAVCDDPDAKEIKFGSEFCIGHNIMMNKPAVLENGEWMFPLAVWDDGVYVVKQSEEGFATGSYAYVTRDGGHFEIRDAAQVPERSYDEHMFIESEGTLKVYVRTKRGIGNAVSDDGGTTWHEENACVMPGPSTRFHIRRLPSGRMLLIWHDNTMTREKLTAMLSEDEGKTWKYKFLLDERSDVSYPDAAIDGEGYLNIIYDRERGGFKDSLKDAQKCAREILMARITEDDIMAGKIVSEKSFLKRIVSRLGDYEGENLYK